MKSCAGNEFTADMLSGGLHQSMGRFQRDLQQGVWYGVQVLPSWWAQFVSGPASGWESGCYGGQFWLNRAAEYQLPDDAYYMAGIGEQRVFIVPSAELVIVRLGHRAGDNTAKAAINAMLSSLMETVKEECHT